MSTAIIDLQYLPSIEYFIALQSYDHIILEKYEHFVKQTYRNRCYIRAANKVDTLTVPVTGGNKKIPICDVQIDYGQRWLKHHWRAITSAYGRAPFFEYFIPEFEKIFFKRERFLFEFNLKLLTLCLKILQVEISFSFSNRYQTPEELHNTTNLRSFVHPKSHYSKNNLYQPYWYPQVFGKDFVPNLSIVDLLFCEGPNAQFVVTKSKRPE